MSLCSDLDQRWLQRMFDLAHLVASWSKDTSTKVGAVIAKDKHVVSLGYNGFPAGVDDTPPSRHQRPQKYLYTEHAERNAIYSAHRHGSSVVGCTIYVPLFPCADCARAIIAERIERVVTINPESNPEFFERWRDSIGASMEMFTESGVELHFHEYESLHGPNR